MKKYLLVLSFVVCLTSTVFSQSYAGIYRARFISLERNVNPVAEFEISANGAVSGKVIVGETVTTINGQVDYNGNLEAKSANAGKIIYTLKADLKQSGGKIVLNSRSDENTFGRRNVAQAMMQGSYTRAAAVAGNLPAAVRKSELLIEQANPLFEKTFLSVDAKVIVEKRASINVYHLQMINETDKTERGFYFSLARVQDSPQKIWQVENIRALNYVEKTDNYTKVNRFRTSYEAWLKDRAVASGQIELVSENNRQMVFKITDLKIKNEANSDYVTINGIIYAEISAG